VAADPVIGRAVAAGVMAFLAAGCASSPHEYRWRPPVPVAARDWEACHARADGLAERRYDRYAEMADMAGPFEVPFGGTTLAQNAWQAREDVYEWEMTRCLRARGYDVFGPAVPER
jgi:hypothetical protein